MRNRRTVALVALVIALTTVGACGKSQKALDTEGLSLGKDMSEIVNQAVKALGGVTDVASAQAALPQLTDVDGKLGDLVAKAAKLSPESKQTMIDLVKTAVPSLKTAMERVNAIPGVSDTLKPILDSLMAKLQGVM